jgi:hypothetical protein
VGVGAGFVGGVFCDAAVGAVFGGGGFSFGSFDVFGSFGIDGFLRVVGLRGAGEAGVAD